MSELVLAIGSALWLGVLTSLSPCPLATNIAAVSFLGRRVDSPLMVLGGGLLYALGRTAAYVALGTLLLAGLMSAPGLSSFLQRHMSRLVGPLLILVGLFLLEALSLRLPARTASGGRLRDRLASRGMWGAAPLGALFALSFCPVSAALFFGSLVPLALQAQSPVLIPTTYGAGTALPVVLFAVSIALGARGLGLALKRLALIERWSRRVMAVIFIGVGVYMTLAYTIGLPL